MAYPDSSALVIRRVERPLQDSCSADLKWAIHRLQVDVFFCCRISPLEIVYKLTGKKILFRRLDDGFKITSIAVDKGFLCFMWTEKAYNRAQGTKESYKAMGVKYYEFVATLDHRTSETCRSMDGMVFPVSEYESYRTAPPMHPNCRSTTCPFSENVTERVARIDGKSVNIQNMTYKEWYENMSFLKAVKQIIDLEQTMLIWNI